MISFKADPSLLEPAIIDPELNLSFSPPLGCFPMEASFFTINQSRIATTIGLDTNNTDHKIHAAFMDTVNYISCVVTAYNWDVPDDIEVKRYHFKTTQLMLANWDEMEEDCYRVKEDIIVKEFSFSNEQVQHQKYFVVIEGQPIVSIDFLVPKEQYHMKEDMIKSSIASIHKLIISI